MSTCAPPCRRWAATLVFGALLASRPAFAQGDNADELARRHFESGAAYLEESDYDNALRAFQKAYELSKRPEILLNIATVEERRADIEGAISALKSYLQVAPNGEHADTARLRIKNLEKRRPAASEPVEPSEAAPPTSTPAPPAPRPLEPHPSRVPAFIILGVGAAAAGGALITGIVAKSKYDDLKDSCGPGCTDAQVSSSKTLAWTSTALTGVALVGVGVGVTLLVLSKPNEPVASAQRFELAVAPTLGGAAARAGWRF